MIYTYLCIVYYFIVLLYYTFIQVGTWLISSLEFLISFYCLFFLSNIIKLRILLIKILKYIGMLVHAY